MVIFHGKMPGAAREAQQAASRAFSIPRWPFPTWKPGSPELSDFPTSSSRWMSHEKYAEFYSWLVVLYNHLEKWWSESQWVSDDIPYMKWKIKANGKIKAMCETTNQTPMISLLYQVTQSVIEEGQRVGPLPFTRERNGQVVGVFGV